jgi:hypothetical protein
MSRSKAIILCALAPAFGVTVLCSALAAAQDNGLPARQPVGFAVSAPLRELAKIPQPIQFGFREANPARSIRRPHAGPNLPLVPDPVEQSSFVGPAGNYTIGLNFLGDGYGFPGYTFINAPPDTNIAVGDTQVFETVNSSFVVFNKATGATETGPLNLHVLFAALGGDCANGFQSDPVAQWDNRAHRWLLAQNTFISIPYLACVAISTSPDALGSYYLYAFSLDNGFPDYPKWGRWTNSWTQTINNYGPNGYWWQGAEVCVYERLKLMAGDPSAGQKCFQLSMSDDGLMPVDIDSPTEPPAGEDIFLIGGLGMSDNSHLSLYSVHIDWANPDAATITGGSNSQLITVPQFNPACNGQYRANCVPQEGISDQLDSLGDRLMYRLAYWNDFPSPTPPKTLAAMPWQHFYVNHAVTASGGQMGTRWYEFRAPQRPVPVASLTVYQAGTYAPDANYRWMGSIAQDKANNILLGYSVSSSTMYPSIFIAGRTKYDLPGTLEPELLVVKGTGSQVDTGGRWGDYSSMRIDQDGCTFWYTTEYYMVTQIYYWSSQIANIKFANCH